MKLAIEIDGIPVNGLLLKSVAGTFCERMKSKLAVTGYSELCEQVDNLFVPMQKLAGTANDFSFMVYPVPRLTKEQRMALRYEERPAVELSIGHESVRFSIDGFNRVEWIYLTRASGVFDLLTQAIEACGQSDQRTSLNK